MGKDDLGLGGRPKSSDKKPNMRKQNAAEARKQPRLEPEQAQVDPHGEFGDGIQLTRDWRRIQGIIDQVLKQKEDICWAIALTRLLQAIINMRDKNDYKQFCYLDIVAHLKPNEKENRMRLQNLKDAITHIAVNGLLKLKSSQNRTKPGSLVGYHGKWNFRTEKCPSEDYIRAKVDISPVVISFEISLDFHLLSNRVYKVSDMALEEGKIAVLIVAYGYKDGKLFFVFQNSWGEDWGVKGYGRLFIHHTSKTTLVYPQV